VDLVPLAAACLLQPDPEVKMRLTTEAAAAVARGRVRIPGAELPEPVAEPGRPLRPPLVPPRALPRRTLTRVEGRAALIHALTHIEFNAVNLAWDAVHRFPGMPGDYYRDWVGVAADEARHFLALRARLLSLGCDYGDLPAHDGLWETARRTAHDLVARMALVPRVLEARGLDVTPGLIERLRRAGDPETAQVLVVVLREEIGHVAVGTRWFRHACAARGLRAEDAFFDLLDRHLRGVIRCPLHQEARRQAGFTESELARLRRRCR
jgi:uncharacterized ferritin-like protein (DUF455 family)